MPLEAVDAGWFAGMLVVADPDPDITIAFVKWKSWNAICLWNLTTGNERGNVHALAVSVELPSMITASDPTVLYFTERKTNSPMTTSIEKRVGGACAITKEDQVLVEDLRGQRLVFETR
jgi:hypothetical protein